MGMYLCAFTKKEMEHFIVWTYYEALWVEFDIIYLFSIAV